MKVFYGAFIMFCCAHQLVNCQMTTISGITRNYIEDVGNTVELTCTIFRPMAFNVSWVKVNEKNSNNSVVISNGNTVLIGDSRYSANQDIVFTKYFERNCYTLQILGFQETDVGVYRCQVMNNSAVLIKADTEVKIRIPPTIYNMSKSLTIGEGGLLKIECKASGVPTPSVVWRREGNRNFSDGKTIHKGEVLEFSIVLRTDDGKYYCEATNGVGINAIRELQLIVEFPPFVTMSKPYYSHSSLHYVELNCHVEAYPVPSIVWSQGQVEIFNTSRTKITNIFSSDTVIDSILHINTTPHEYGHYLCKASNAMGTDQVAFKFHV